ncbi:GQ67_02616T0 [Komagataella phaffii]|nr:GQ67_02616T0 [Komagataella phaffii]AOA66554.1 GQ68_02632T0 [Komagataella phaffii GS115]
MKVRILGLIAVLSVVSAGYQTYCRCQCGDESQVLELTLQEDAPSSLNNANICQLCTRDRCREEIDACSKIPQEKTLELIEIQCFSKYPAHYRRFTERSLLTHIFLLARESFKIKLVVYLFVLIVTALLLNIVWWSRQTS